MSARFLEWCDRIAYHVRRRVPDAQYDSPTNEAPSARLAFRKAAVTIWVRPSGFWQADFLHTGGSLAVGDPAKKENGYRFDHSDAGHLGWLIATFFEPSLLERSSPSVKRRSAR